VRPLTAAAFRGGSVDVMRRLALAALLSFAHSSELECALTEDQRAELLLVNVPVR